MRFIFQKGMVVKNQREVVDSVKKCAKWWVGVRKKKLEEQLSETMSINPFLMPFLFDYHDLSSLDDLVGLVMASHLMTGHATGFGKLIDEKILPNVFGTTKLDAEFRNTNAPFEKSCFDEIDHLIIREDGLKQLLSLKAGRWTIQLTMAVQLNASFKEILENHEGVADEIVVGVFYGKSDDLTDKYDILRGVNRGANHNVTDLTDHVSVFAGREFWSWLNYGEDNTQEWVLQGVIEALREENIHETATDLLRKFKSGIVEKYESDIRDEHENVLNWYKLLKKVNG